MFKPSSTQAAVIVNANPAAYQLLREKFPKGDKRRIMTRTDLWDFRACPNKWLRSEPSEPTSAMEWGALMDCLILTPHLFEKTYVVAPAKYKSKGMQCQTPGCSAQGSVTDAQKCGKCRQPRVEVEIEKDWDWNATYCDEFRIAAKKEGKVVVKEALVSDAWKAKKRMEEDAEISHILGTCEKQVQINVEWHDKETGLVIPYSCLLDLVPPPDSDIGDTFWDLKETNDATRKTWQRRIYSDGLDYQLAIYKDALNVATGKKYRSAGHVIQESVAPFEPTVRPLEDEWLREGQFNYQRDFRLYCHCLLTGKFPGFDRNPIGPEIWMLSEKS